METIDQKRNDGTKQREKGEGELITCSVPVFLSARGTGGGKLKKSERERELQAERKVIQFPDEDNDLAGEGIKVSSCRRQLYRWRWREKIRATAAATDEK